ncbi:MAG: hypothetical protein M1826_002437 [Phylliscum demangeonii]|nr:MAG: hypothetical protein M1826_002437 [Phylliscum demangeonii]
MSSPPLPTPPLPLSQMSATARRTWDTIARLEHRRLAADACSRCQAALDAGKAVVCQASLNGRPSAKCVPCILMHLKCDVARMDVSLFPDPCLLRGSLLIHIHLFQAALVVPAEVGSSPPQRSVLSSPPVPSPSPSPSRPSSPMDRHSPGRAPGRPMPVSSPWLVSGPSSPSPSAPSPLVPLPPQPRRAGRWSGSGSGSGPLLARIDALERELEAEKATVRRLLRQIAPMPPAPPNHVRAEPST